MKRDDFHIRDIENSRNLKTFLKALIKIQKASRDLSKANIARNLIGSRNRKAFLKLKQDQKPNENFNTTPTKSSSRNPF
jgi:hypothetical protein